MTDLTCAEVQDAAAEFALGILPTDERSRVARHLLRCRDCRRDVEELGLVGEELLGLVPDAEPPLGFDRRVLAAVQTPRRRRVSTWVAAATGTAAAVAAVTLALVQPDTDTHYYQTAALTSDGHVMGSVRTEGQPPWVWMTVHGAAASGRATCDVVTTTGSTVQLGSFDLVGGSGTWAAPEPAMSGRIAAVRLVDSTGQVIATATFKA